MIDIEDAVAPLALNVFPQLEVRYSDGYQAATAIVGFGNLVKVLGAIAGVIIAVVGLFAASQSGVLLFAGVVIGGLVWLGLFVGGVVICAQGQLLLATLDSAVNNSPFLDNSQRASIMSLSETRAAVAAGTYVKRPASRCPKCNSPFVNSSSPENPKCGDCGCPLQSQ